MTSFFTPENATCQQIIEELINQTTCAILAEFKSGVVSIMLLGSLVRGEGIWKVGKTTTQILSDVDLLVVTRWQRTMTPSLRRTLRTLERSRGVTLDIRIAPLMTLPFYDKNIDTFETKEHNKLLWGANVLNWLPRFHGDELDYRDIFFSFFNEAILSIEKVSPYDLAKTSEKNLARISHRAAKTLFTCASIICLHCGCYRPTVAGRVAFINETSLLSLEIPVQTFRQDLSHAFSFRFREPRTTYIKEAPQLWRRARRYLVDLFFQFLAARYSTRDMFTYPKLIARELSWRERLRDIYRCTRPNRFFILPGGISLIIKQTSPTIQCKMAALMLYLALDDPPDASYLKHAQSYLLKIYPSHRIAHDQPLRQWFLLRDDVKVLRQSGLV